MSFLIEQYRLFRVALQRDVAVRLPQWVKENDPDQRPALRYFPLAGLLVGIFCGLVYIAATRWFPPAVAVLLATLSGLLITRALHERGLGRTVNGLAARSDANAANSNTVDGGMDNSAGAVAICMVLLLKFSALAYLPDEWVVTALICGHALSRFAALPLIVRFGQRASTHADTWIGPGECLTAAFYGLLPLVFVVTNRSLEPQMHGPLLIGAGAAFGIAALMGWVLSRSSARINPAGLSALQQGAEVMFYLGLLISPR